MKKYIVLLMAIFAIGIYAAQDASLTIRQVRDPVQLREKLNANAADAQARLVVVESLKISTNNLGAKSITFTSTLCTNVLHFNTQGALTNAVLNP